MKRRTAVQFSLFLLATAGGIATLALSLGQSPSNSGDPGTVKQASYAAPPQQQQARTAPPGSDPAHLSEPLRNVWHSARSGSEWLMRMDNPVNGRFHPGWLPDLNVPVGQDHYLNQAGAAYALAKAARYFGDDRYLMKARQATLSLLADTQADAADPACRRTTLPPVVVNRTAAAGILLMIIHELESPANELLTQGEELCQFIRQQQQPDGSLRCNEVAEGTAEQESSRCYPGLALHGLLVSMRNRPAPWKLEVAARALPIYRAQWKASPSLALSAGLTLAFAEAYLQTRNLSYAEFVFEMSDWVCGLQYTGETGNGGWAGGFRSFQRGIPISTPPTVSAAANLEAIAQACLVTRHVPDATRYAKYRSALDAGSQLLIGLQYTSANTLHFTPEYRPVLLGGFHASQQDGSLRLDYQQHALGALVQRLQSVGDQ